MKFCPRYLKYVSGTFYYLVCFFTEPISFDSTNSQQSVEEGVPNFVLVCNVSGNPKPGITWNVRGSIIRGGSDKKYKVTKQGLVIYNVSKEDQGSYKCKATQFDEGITDFKDMVIELKVEREFCCYCLLYTSPSPRDRQKSRMPSSA